MVTWFLGLKLPTTFDFPLKKVALKVDLATLKALEINCSENWSEGI